jgi:hypothetical protein
MSEDIKPMIDFLKSRGIEKVGHTKKTYLAHLVNLYRYLEERGAGPDACRAGIFHSIYGTERFQGFKLSLEDRPTIAKLIGERAEHIAYLNCAMDRTSFDRAVERGTAPYRFIDRLTQKEVEVAPDDFDDLCRVHLYDWLEQVPRAEAWDYRRAAYRRLAERLGDVAKQTFDEVYAAAKV